jgi:lysophospholipase L1-like esterase
MPLGDSITQADASHDSYRRPLWQMLRGQAVDFVGTRTEHYGGPAPRSDFDQDHEGHWGWRADEVLGGVSDWARSQAPDVVLMHLGTNDILQGESPGAILDELDAIVDALRSANPEVRVLVAQIIPTGDAGRNAAVRAFNSGIAGLAARRSTPRSPVAAVDQYTGFDADADTYDGLHPNAGGEAKMAARWFDALVPLLRPTALPGLLSAGPGEGGAVW